MGFLKQDLIYAIRQLRKKPGFTLIAVLILAFGIGANTAFFSVINATLLQRLPYPHENQLVHLRERGITSNGTMPVSYQDFLDWKRQQTSFSGLTIYRTAATVNMKIDGSAQRMSTVMVDEAFLKVLGFQPMFGRDLRAEDDAQSAQPAILLPYTTWVRDFGSNSQVVGRVVDVDGRSATIVGVLPQTFHFFSDPDLILPLGPFLTQYYMQDRHNHSNARVLGRLREGVTPVAAASEMSAIASRLAEQYPKSNGNVGVELMGLHQYLIGATAQRQLLLMIASGLVLLIVCVNVATMFLARSWAREHEMAIRAALGALRTRLVSQIMIESLLIAAIGGVLSLVLAVELGKMLKSLVPAALLQFSGGDISVIDWRVMLFTTSVTLLTGIGFGLIPAWQLSQTSPHEVLKEHRTKVTRLRGGLQALDVLVVVQVASAALLLVTSSLALYSLWTLSNKSLGYEPEHILSLRIASPSARLGETPLRVAAFYQEAADRLAQLPGVEFAAITTNAAFGTNDSHNQFRIEDRPVPKPSDYPSASYRAVSADYFKTMSIPILQGRVFNGTEPMPPLPSGIPSMQDAIDALRKIPIEMVVTRSFAQRYWPTENPIGKGVLLGPPDRAMGHATVIGVIGDTTQDSLGQTDHQEYYLSLRQFPFNPENYLLLRTHQNPATLIEAAKAQIRQLTTTEPVYDVRPLATRVTDSISGQTFQSRLVAAFAILALVLASLGLYGVLAFNVGRRTRDIGIRMALGASRRSVVGKVFSRGFAMVIPGLALGSAGAWMLNRALQSQFSEVSIHSPFLYEAALIPLLFAAALACWLPARHAAKVDPMIALRED